MPPLSTSYLFSLHSTRIQASGFETLEQKKSSICCGTTPPNRKHGQVPKQKIWHCSTTRRRSKKLSTMDFVENCVAVRLRLKSSAVKNAPSPLTGPTARINDQMTEDSRIVLLHSVCSGVGELTQLLNSDRRVGKPFEQRHRSRYNSDRESGSRSRRGFLPYTLHSVISCITKRTCCKSRSTNSLKDSRRCRSQESERAVS